MLLLFFLPFLFLAACSYSFVFFFDFFCLLVIYFLPLSHCFYPYLFLFSFFFKQKKNPVSPQLVTQSCFISSELPVSNLLLTGLLCTCTASTLSTLYTLLIPVFLQSLHLFFFPVLLISVLLITHDHSEAVLMPSSSDIDNLSQPVGSHPDAQGLRWHWAGTCMQNVFAIINIIRDITSW